jgi:glycosyltransferase involved in cell wall biosynthesis
MARAVKASVIIPTRNRAALLERCLQSLTLQTQPVGTFEVLIVDNGSTDNTATVANHYTNVLELKYVRVPNPGLHVGRHEGIRRARTDVLMFADDDVEACPTWVEAVTLTFEVEDVALVGGNNYPLFEKEPPAWLLRLWERPAYKGRALPSLSILDLGKGVFEIDPGYVWGCNFSIRRSAILQAGGFHPDAVPMEQLRFRGDGETYVTDTIRKAGLRTVFNSSASVRHLVSEDRTTVAYFASRAYAQGISDSFADIRHNGGPNLPLSIRIRRCLPGLRCAFDAIRSSVMVADDTVEHELRVVQQVAARAYRKGYRFHQREVRRDPALLAWVLKPHYWE